MPFNLNTILDKTPYGGFRAGMADQDAIYQSNSGLANDAMQRGKVAQDMETVALRRPLDAIEQARKIAKEESDLRDIQSGGYDRDRQIKRETEQADLQKKLTDNQMKTLENRLLGVQAAGQIFGDDVDPAKMAMNWETARSEAKQYGFDLGEYNQQNAEKFLRMKQSTPMAIKLYENQIRERQRLETELIREGAQSGYKTAEAMRHEAWQGGQNDAQRRNAKEVASIYASRAGGGSGGAANTMTKLEAQAINDVDAWMEGKSKQVPSETDLTIYENKLINKRIDNKAFEMLERLGMLQAYTSGDPTARAKLQQLRTEAAMSDPVVASFRAVRAKAAAARGGGSVTTTAPTKELTPEQKALRAKHGL